MKKKILITGHDGFIGKNLWNTLSHDYNLEGWDIDRDIFYLHDEEFSQINPDVVVHLAALTSVGDSFKNPGEYYRTNVLGTARIVELCHKYQKKLIYPSSAAVYHPELSPYADSKYLAEQVVSRMKDSMPTVILRLYNVFGPGMNQRTGSVMYRYMTDNKITVYGDGEQTRDFIHVRDVCSIIMEAIKSPRWDGKVVDVGMGEEWSMNYIAGLFAHYRGLKVGYMEPKREIKWSKAPTAMLKFLYKKKLTTNIEKDIKELCLPQ